MSASSSDALNNIFNSFADLVEGGSGTTLDSQSVIKDIVAPSFQLPPGSAASDILLETYAYGPGGSWTTANILFPSGFRQRSPALLWSK